VQTMRQALDHLANLHGVTRSRVGCWLMKGPKKSVTSDPGRRSTNSARVCTVSMSINQAHKIGAQQV